MSGEELRGEFLSLHMESKTNFDTGDYSSAVSSLTAIIEKARLIEGYPAVPVDLKKQIIAAYNGRAMCFGNLREFDKAIDDYTEIIENLDDKFSPALSNRSGVLAELGRNDESIADATRVIDEIDDKNACAYSHRSIALMRKGQYDDVLADVNTIIQICEEDSCSSDVSEELKLRAHAGAYAHRGLIAGLLGDFDKQIADCRKAIELNEKSVGAYVNLASGLIKKEMYEEANSVLRRANELNGESMLVTNTFGDLFNAKGETEKAKEFYQKTYDLFNNTLATVTEFVSGIIATKRLGEMGLEVYQDIHGALVTHVLHQGYMCQEHIDNFTR